MNEQKIKSLISCLRLVSDAALKHDKLGGIDMRDMTYALERDIHQIINLSRDKEKFEQRDKEKYLSRDEEKCAQKEDNKKNKTE